MDNTSYVPPRQGGYNPPASSYTPPVGAGSGQPQYGGAQQQGGLVAGGFKPRPRVMPDPEALAAAFSYDGYQVVRREFFSHIYEPTLTIRDKSVTFNNSCIRKLDEVVYIQFLLNPDQNKLVVRPCAEGARDAIRWCVAKGDTRKSRQISCERFTSKLFNMMGWENLYRYKLQGTQITYQGEQIYVFDLMNVEPVTPQTIGADGKRKRGQVVEPEEWQTSFGLGVDEHAASTQVDLSQGFEQVDPSVRQFEMEEVMKV